MMNKYHIEFKDMNDDHIVYQTDLESCNVNYALQEASETLKKRLRVDNTDGFAITCKKIH